MQRFLWLLEWGTSRCGFILLLIMSFVIGLQVFMRYVLNDALMWPEEMTRYCYLWVSMLAIVVTEQQRAHLRIDVLRNYVGKKCEKLFDIFSSIVTILFYGVFIYLSIKMTILVNNMGQYAVSFDLPLVYIWIAFPALFIVALVFAVVNFGTLFRKSKG